MGAPSFVPGIQFDLSVAVRIPQCHPPPGIVRWKTVVRRCPAPPAIPGIHIQTLSVRTTIVLSSEGDIGFLVSVDVPCCESTVISIRRKVLRYPSFEIIQGITGCIVPIKG